MAARLHTILNFYNDDVDSEIMVGLFDDDDCRNAFQTKTIHDIIVNGHNMATLPVAFAARFGRDLAQAVTLATK